MNGNITYFGALSTFFPLADCLLGPSMLAPSPSVGLLPLLLEVEVCLGVESCWAFTPVVLVLVVFWVSLEFDKEESLEFESFLVVSKVESPLMIILGVVSVWEGREGTASGVGMLWVDKVGGLKVNAGVSALLLLLLLVVIVGDWFGVVGWAEVMWIGSFK